MKPLRNSIHKFLKSAEVTFFEGLYRDYFTRTLFFAQQYLPDPEEAREIAQETFVTLWEKRTEIRPDLSVQAFILTIAKHKCLNVLRKKIAEQKYSDSLTARETMANYSALICSVLSVFVAMPISPHIRTLPSFFHSSPASISRHSSKLKPNLVSSCAMCS